MARNPYKDADGHPLLRKSVAVFVDMLGYADLIETAHKEAKDLDVLNLLRKSLDDAFQHINFSPEIWASAPAPWLVKSFSDNVVVGLPTREHDGLDVELISGRFGTFQLDLALEGFFVRGGIALGDLYLDEEIVFGPALIDAHNCESLQAVNPRVVLHGSAEKAIEAEFKRTEHLIPSMPAYNRCFCRDADGLLFVNYLSSITEFEYDDRIYFETLDRHRTSVEAKLSEFSTDTRILSKYLWSASYHNWFCDVLTPHDDEARSHKIDVPRFLPCPRASR